MHTHLQAIADAENGDAQLENLGVDVRRVAIIHRVGRARQYHACVYDTIQKRCARDQEGTRTLGFPSEIFDLLRAWHKLSVHIKLTTPASD
jgi:hypothetical protein